MFFQLLINNWFEKFLENIVDTHSEISKLRMEIAVLTEKLANQTSTAELKIPPEKENPVLYSRIYNYTNACLTEARYFFFYTKLQFFHYTIMYFSWPYTDQTENFKYRGPKSFARFPPRVLFCGRFFC